MSVVPIARKITRQPIESFNLTEALLKVQTVGSVTGLSASSIFRKVASGEFPEPVRFGKRCTRWKASGVRAWLTAQGPQAVAE